jgi:hypothetical protein
MVNAVFWNVAPCISWFAQDLHGVTSQKTSFFIVTAVKTSNLTQCICMFRMVLTMKSVRLSVCFVFYLTTLPVTQDHVASNDWMVVNNELVRI